MAQADGRDLKEMVRTLFHITVSCRQSMGFQRPDCQIIIIDAIQDFFWQSKFSFKLSLPMLVSRAQKP